MLFRALGLSKGDAVSSGPAGSSNPGEFVHQ